MNEIIYLKQIVDSTNYSMLKYLDYNNLTLGMIDIELVSNYIIDYILHHLNFLVGHELKNSDSIKNANFKDFLTSVGFFAYQIMVAKLNLIIQI